MINIGIDARLYSQTGVGVYISNLLYHLQGMTGNEFKIFVYLLPQDMEKIQFKNKNYIKRPSPYRWHTFSEQLSFVKLLYKDNLNLMHFTYFSYPVLYRRKFISTIHDVTPLLFKTGLASTKNPLFFQTKHFLFRHVLSSQIKGAHAIITPTYTVKKNIIKLYGNKYEHKIYPIYEGVNHELPNKKENAMLKNKFHDKFFIYVGNFYPHKNVEKLVQAFSKVTQSCKLLLIGPKDFFSERLTRLINRLNLVNKVIFYHKARKEDLIFFYKNAQALVHPSLSEGFGLPLIEAAYFDLPIIASNIEVFSEVLDDKYLAFNPNNVDDIAQKLNEFIKKRKTFNYSNLLRRYSFKNMAKETFGIYKQYV